VSPPILFPYLYLPFWCAKERSSTCVSNIPLIDEDSFAKTEIEVQLSTRSMQEMHATITKEKDEMKKDVWLRRLAVFIYLGTF